MGGGQYKGITREKIILKSVAVDDGRYGVAT